MPPLRIAVDIDEVLCPFFHPMIKRIGKTPPKKSHPYVYRKALNITEEDSQKMVRDFYASQDFKKLPIITHSDRALSYLKDQGHILYAVTGRQDVARNSTETWLNKNFSGVFTDLVTTNSFTPKEIPKSHLCLALNLQLIVDDSFDTCKDCKNEGIDAIHFTGSPMYPWCHVTDPDIKRMSSWSEMIPLETPIDCSDEDSLCLIPDNSTNTPLLPRRRVEPPW